jgi:hypothetical protein
MLLELTMGLTSWSGFFEVISQTMVETRDKWYKTFYRCKFMNPHKKLK